MADRRIRIPEAWRSLLLLAALLALSASVGYLLVGGLGLVIGIGVVVLLGMIAGRLPAGLVLRMQGGRPLARWQAPGLYRLLEGLAVRAALPLPRLYLMNAKEPNAMAVGGPDGRGAIAVTRGLLNLLSPAELEGVLAHELAHLKHNDSALLTFSGMLVRAVSAALELALWIGLISLLLIGGSLSRLLFVGALALSVPVVVRLLQAALSRSREFAADDRAARITGRPRSLASALLKLQQRQSFLRWLMGRDRAAAPLLRSHPVMRDRVARLLALAPPGYGLMPSTR